MNTGLLAGLGGFAMALGKDITKQQDEDREDKRAELKARLAYKMQMDLLKAKQEYMKANPTYKHFVNTAVGDIIAFDEFGTPKLISGTPETKQAAKEKADAANALKQGQATEAAARLGLIGAQTEAAKARAGRDARYVQGAGKAPPKDPHILSPIQWEKAASDIVKKNNDPNIPFTPEDAEYGALREKAEKQLQSMGYSKGFQATAGGGLAAPNPFANLIPQASAAPEENEDSDDGDVLNY